MSSATVSQILQVATARTDSKPQPPSQGQGEEFQRLLARTAGSGEQRPAATAETTEAPETERPLADNSQQDAATTGGDQSTTTTDPLALAAADGEESIVEGVAEELLLDEIQLSDAAIFAVAAQLPTTTDYPVEVVEVTVDAELAPAPENCPHESPAKPLAVVGEFTQTLHPQQQTEEAEEIVPEIEVALDEQPVPKHPTPEKVAAELPGAKPGTSSPNRDPAEIIQPTLQPIQAPVDNTPAAPVKLPKPVQVTTKQAKAVLVEEPSPVGEETEVTEKPVKARVGVTAAEKQEVAAIGDAQVSVDQDSAPEIRSPELPPTHHGRSESSQNAMRSEQTAGGDSAAPTDAAADSDPVSTVDRARFVQRVSRAFQSAHGRDGVIQMRLSPPELGSLRIVIATHQGVLSAKVEADTAAARNVILDNLPALRERLAEQQIRLEKFDVDVRRDGGQDANNWQAADRQPRNSDNSHGANQVRQSAVAGPRVARPLGGVTDGSLDVRV